ncbi:MAG: type II secretion system protein [Candidatus Cloacimonas sp.]|jgi:prepilin-type N-terminal cleavage/methylation domain-containing protein|nr:type II secretion system protein [Candidatus Cloacimonas sp.]
MVNSLNTSKFHKAVKPGLLNQKGFTLIEIISVLVISTLLITIAGVGLSVFFGRYQELNAYVELQKDAMEFLNYLKNGYNVGSGAYIQFNGIASARALEITGRTEDAGVGNGIRITPPAREEFPNDFMHIYLAEGVIKANYMYNGVQVNTPIYMFPKRALRNKVKIESFKIGDANANNAIFRYKPNEGLCVVNVQLKARVETSDNKYIPVVFNTVMAMKNMERPITGEP